MDNSPDKKEIIKNLFFNLFQQKGYGAIDSFDFSIWFIKNNDKRSQSQAYFKELLSQTPTESEDIIKFLLIKSFFRAKNPNYRIRVEEFVQEITDVIISLKEENKRLDTLIAKYDAYETLNTIEQSIKYFDKYVARNQDKMKSHIKAYVTRIEHISAGHYKFSLLVSSLNPNVNCEDNNISNEANVKEECLEYKINHVVRILEDSNVVEFDDNEYYFQDLEFFSFETKGKTHKFDSGTNLLYFQVKMENLNKNYEDIVISDQKPILELFLGNVKQLMNNFKKVKILETILSISNSFYDITLTLKINVEFDPWTQLAIYGKITELLKNMISYKVLVEHKYKTIMAYFSEIANEIEDILDDTNKKKSSDCNIY